MEGFSLYDKILQCCHSPNLPLESTADFENHKISVRSQSKIKDSISHKISLKKLSNNKSTK